jgi:hypothetical protein
MRFASIPQSDFGGVGIDEPFDVREGVRKDGEPTTKMIP